MAEYSVEVIAGDSASITSVTGAATLEVMIDSVVKVGTVNEVSAVEVILPGPVILGSVGGSAAALDAHIASATPHSAYDVDISSLTILFENGLI